MTSSPEALRRQRLASNPAAPWCTWYRSADHARIELSGLTVDNWIAKLGSFLSYECELEPGDFIAIDLPRHWLTPLWVQAAWSIGVGIDRSHTADIVITSLERAEFHHHTGEAVWLSPTDAWGMPVTAGEVGEDAISLVRNFGDSVFWPIPDPETPAVKDTAGVRSAADLADLRQAAQQAIAGAQRFASNAQLDTEAGLYEVCLLPTLADASLVYIDADAPAEVRRITSLESVSDTQAELPSGWWH